MGSWTECVGLLFDTSQHYFESRNKFGLMAHDSAKVARIIYDPVVLQSLLDFTHANRQPSRPI